MQEKRLHFVLVPGFGAFDALGQIQYYAGVTPVFRRWRDGLINHDLGGNGFSGEQKGLERANTSLHYFDNFPTASVKTRAERLRTFLCERIARGEFSITDRVVLIGHSTAGLDIRRLICDLDADSKDRMTYLADGYSVSAKEVLEVIDHVVFISVPQKGTNIACWTDWLWAFCKLSLADLRSSVEASQIVLVDQLEALMVEALALTDIDLVLAARDTLSEARLKVAAPGAETAMAQESAAELALWLRHIFWDFGAVKDMLPRAPFGFSKTDMVLASPAHFSAQDRKEELAIWRSHGINAKSYATLARSPFQESLSDVFNPLTLLKPSKYLRMLAEAMDCKTDLPFALTYQLCTSGTYAEKEIPLPRHCGYGSLPAQLRAGDNDGIVNTASMLWPHGEDTTLVNCDHMDIVGHFQRVPRKLQGGRRYEAYDLLKSDSGFDQSVFEAVWCDVFNSCLIKQTAPSSEPAGRKRSAVAAVAV